MNALAIFGIIFACLCLALMGWSLVRINHPRTPEEEKAQWEQDLKDFDADMAARLAKRSGEPIDKAR
jgi:hypothetical protein